MQGNLRDSSLDPPLFSAISDKLNRYAGLYIYRDGIRVLPYGNSEFDFLDVELRRSKSASDAFFSYRRMFGVIELWIEGRQMAEILTPAMQAQYLASMTHANWQRFGASVAA